jgi:polar amino acid transport system substrate-binding protein
LEAPKLKRFHGDAVKVLDRYFAENGDFQCGGLPYSRMREEVGRGLEKVREAAQRIKHIVDDLKDFARRDDNGDHVPLDLNAVAQAAVRLTEPSLRKAPPRFRAEYAPDLPALRGNPQRIEQVLINLLLNACQALPDPSRAIELVTRHDPESKRAILQVRDEGSGIAPENLSRLTDPFFTTKRDSGGTGLGLSVSAGIVKEHGGTLEFASVPGETLVTLSLPVFQEEPTP